MEETRGAFAAVRRLSQGGSADRGAAHCRSSSADDAVAASTAWIGRGFSCVCAPSREYNARLLFDLSHLTPFQEERLQRLHNRIEVMYDGTKIEHQETLKSLWSAAFPGEEFQGLISEKWKEMGWQGKDPSTDFRGGGFISLENLLFFARHFPRSFRELLRKQAGDRALWEYPFAIAGVNITFMLIQMLGLLSVKPRTLAGAVFLKLLSENESAFDLLYCISFKLMDYQWLAMHASYMDFNVHRYKGKWIMDSGCSRHMTGDTRRLEDNKEEDGGIVLFRNNKSIILGTGTVDSDEIHTAAAGERASVG